MEEKKFVLTEEQLDAALHFAAMGGAGLLPPNSTKDMLEKLPKDLAERALAAALTAGCIREEGPLGAIITVLKMVAEGTKTRE